MSDSDFSPAVRMLLGPPLSKNILQNKNVFVLVAPLPPLYTKTGPQKLSEKC